MAVSVEVFQARLDAGSAERLLKTGMRTAVLLFRGAIVLTWKTLGFATAVSRIPAYGVGAGSSRLGPAWLARRISTHRTSRKTSADAVSVLSDGKAGKAVLWDPRGRCCKLEHRIGTTLAATTRSPLSGDAWEWQKPY